MKDSRKAGSFNIRDMPENSKKSVREEPSKTKTSLMSDLDKKRKTQPKLQSNFEMQKQFVRAENLSPEQQLKIRKEAEKTVNRKARSTEVKIENQIISMLERECSKLGQEAETEKLLNQKLRSEIVELRKNIDYLNTKIDNIDQANHSLSRNNDSGKMEKDQLRDELQKARTALQRSEQHREHQKDQLESKIGALQAEVQEQTERNLKIMTNIKNMREEKEEIEEELEQKNRQYQYAREQYEQRKKDLDQMKQEMQTLCRDNLDRKGQKITRFQVQLQGLSQKLRQQQGVRRKVVEKNKQLQKQVVRKGEVVRDMQDQIGSMKKRINDLSILKSSNNAIMNQKLVQLNEENTKLKKSIELLQDKKGVAIQQQQESKPFLFGPEDD